MEKLKLLDNESLIKLVEILADNIGTKSIDIINEFIVNNNCTVANKNNSLYNINDNTPDVRSIKPKKVPRVFDITKYHQRHIALQIQYEGEDYFGFASQLREDEQTIEQHLFSAFIKLRLIESRQTCNYSRCGRTDRGVSALGQVIALNMRSAFPLGTPLEDIPKHPNDSLIINKSDKSITIKEIDYITEINKQLPESIRVISWCEVTSEFDARFSATHRTYRYFFKRRNLNINNMIDGANLLVGTHDFRNFCKIDIVNVSNFIREIFYAKIFPFSTIDSESYDSIWILEIKGIAFLWHMVRCIMSILLLIGENKENPSIITSLLDISIIKSKPSYNMANELPLLLYDCGYDNLNMLYLPNNLWMLICHYQSIINKYYISISRLKTSQSFIENCYIRQLDSDMFINSQLSKANKTSIHCNNDDSIEPNIKKVKLDFNNQLVQFKDVVDILASYNIYPDNDNTSPYIPLLERQRGETYEQRKEKVSGSRKEKLKNHNKFKSEVVVNNTEFFAKMRKEGSV